MTTSRTTNGPVCEAWIVDRGVGPRRECVLAAGHYNEKDEGAGAKSWHTDCPNVPGLTYPLENHDHRHINRSPDSCLTWADWAEGAHPDTANMPPATPANETGRDLTGLGDYRAQVQIGDTGMTVRGTAKIVSMVIRAFADAFEEEAER